MRDIECANARRAESAIALQEERERRQALELESERKLAELRTEIRLRDEAARAAEAAEAAALEAAYEAQWAAGEPGDVPAAPAAVGDALQGTPLSAVASMPVTGETLPIESTDAAPAMPPRPESAGPAGAFEPAPPNPALDAGSADSPRNAEIDGPPTL